MDAKPLDRDARENKPAADTLKNDPLMPATPETASSQAELAKRCTYLGDYDATLALLAPYLLDSHGECVPNLQVISQIESPTIRANLMVEIALLLNHVRGYASAVDLIHHAIELYDRDSNHYSKANAYHWLAFTYLNRHNFQESERCELKRMELVYQQANREKRPIGLPGEFDLSQIIATSRIWLGILAQRQGLLMKAKTELYTARELMQGEGGLKDPRAWGDLYSTLGRVYSCEGCYDNAIQETNKAIDFYAQAGHLTFEVQTRINLARIYFKKVASQASSKDDQSEAKRHLELATETLERKLPQGDLRTSCLLNLTYSWYYFTGGNWGLSEKMADEAIRHAKKLGSNSLLADCYRARADAAVQLHKLSEARGDLNSAMEYATSVSQHKTLGAILLSFARSYCSKVDPDQIEVDKYLDRFIEIRSRYSFESKYLDDLLTSIKRDRLELPSQRAFYFSIDDLQSAGYDAGLAKYLVWAMRSARLNSHGDIKKMTEVLHFNTLSRTYKYVKLARALESGKGSAAQKVNKTHTIRKNLKR